MTRAENGITRKNNEPLSFFNLPRYENTASLLNYVEPVGQNLQNNLGHVVVT